MLFDIEDYATTYRAIQDALDKEASNGADYDYDTWMPTVADMLESRGSIMGDMEDPYTTARATRDAFVKAVGEYYYSYTGACSLSWIELAETKKNECDLAFNELAPHWRNFWFAMVSFNVYGQGFVNGDYVESRDIIFTIMTQEIYDDYHFYFKNYMTKVKELIEAFGDTIQ